MAAPNSFTGTSAGFGALGTVTILSPATGQVLLWDGNQWSNANVDFSHGRNCFLDRNRRWNLGNDLQ